MMKRIKSAVLASSTKALVVGLMVGALLVATAGFVAAQSSTVIQGCIQKQTGVLRVPQTGSCDPKNETAISWNQVGPQGPQGTQGPQGPQGETGGTGPAGPAGISGLTMVKETSLLLPRSGSEERVTCPSSKKALGGGAGARDPNFPIPGGFLDTPVEIKNSNPMGDSGTQPTTWQVWAFNHDFISSYPVDVYVICANVN